MLSNLRLWIVGLLAMVALTSCVAGNVESTRQVRVVPEGTRLILDLDDIGLINQELATKGSVTLPVNVESAPQGCPDSTNDHCIWICTGDHPLDSIDDNTCSTDVWICRNCDGNPDVCETGGGERVPCE